MKYFSFIFRGRMLFLCFRQQQEINDIKYNWINIRNLAEGFPSIWCSLKTILQVPLVLYIIELRRLRHRGSVAC